MTITNLEPVVMVAEAKDVELVPLGEELNIRTDENGETLISGRELHESLKVKTKYNDWFERMVGYGFAENIDYILVTQKKETNNPKNPYTTYTDHLLKLDMAKEIAMIQRTPEGKRIRQYLIQVEKAWNSPEKIMERALSLIHI